MPPAANLRDYVATTKPRVVGLTVVTAGTAVVLAGGLSPLRFTAVLVGTALTVGGADALNHYLERDRDRLMERTRTRPLPGGRLAPGQVLRFGVALATGGILLLLATAGWLSAFFAGLGVAYYVLVYTILLKPRSPRSVVPGGVAGVFPPLIGWAATGRPLSLAVVYLCSIVFLWSPPHFWALALARREDYARAGIPTLPVVRGSLATRREMAAYTLALVGLSVLPVANGTFGLGYLFPALVGGAGLAVLGLAVARSDSAGLAWLFYRVSGPYLALLLAAMLLDHLTGSPTLGTPGGMVWIGSGPAWGP